MNVSFPLKTESNTLPPLVKSGMTCEQFEQEREAIREKVLRVFGTFPAYPQVSYRVVGEVTLTPENARFGGRVYEIVLPSSRDETTAALLFVPDGAKDAKCPGIVAAHQTSNDFRHCFVHREGNIATVVTRRL